MVQVSLPASVEEEEIAKEAILEEVDIDLDQGEVPEEEQREVLGSLIEPLIKEGMDDEPISHQQVVCNEKVEVQVEDKIDSNSACVIENIESFESKGFGLLPEICSEELAHNDVVLFDLV